MYAAMDNNKCPDMQLKFGDSWDPSVFITGSNVGGTGLNHTAVSHAVITQKFWVLTQQGWSFAKVIWVGQNRVLHAWLLNMGPSGYDNHASDID